MTVKLSILLLVLAVSVCLSTVRAREIEDAGYNPVPQGRATNWEKRHIEMIRSQSSADKSHGSPLDGPKLDTCKGMWIGDPMTDPLPRHSSFGCLKLAVQGWHNLPQVSQQKGGPLHLSTPIGFVCRGARAPEGWHAGRSSTCMTEFSTPYCNAGGAYQTVQNKPFSYNGGNNWGLDKFHINFEGKDVCGTGYTVNSVQCEIRWYQSKHRRGTLGVFRVTPSDMLLAEEDGFINVPVFRHSIAPWPTFQWLFGRPAGGVVVRLTCGDGTFGCFRNRFVTATGPYPYRNAKGERLQESLDSYQNNLFGWQRRRPSPVALSKVQNEAWQIRDETPLQQYKAETPSEFVLRDPSYRQRVKSSTVGIGVRSLASMIPEWKIADEATEDLLLQDRAQAKSMYGGKKKEPESVVLKEHTREAEQQEIFSLGNVKREREVQVGEDIRDRLAGAHSWMTLLGQNAGEAKALKEFTWTDHGGCPLVFSHRAVYAQGDVENTLDAALKSALAGVDGLEIDVFMTGSYEYGGYAATLLHDVNLDRLIGYAQSIQNWNYFTLQRFNQMKERLAPCDLFPTLSDLLRLVNALDLKLNIELKPGEPDIIEAPFKNYAAKLGHEVGRLIRKHVVADRVVVSSFDPEKLRYVNEGTFGPTGTVQEPRYQRKVRVVSATYKTISSKILTKYGKIFGKMGARGECVHYSLVTKKMMERNHEKDNPVGVYTIYDLAEDPQTGPSFQDSTIKKLIDLKVDWIETDNPKRLQEALRRLGCRTTRDYVHLAHTRQSMVLRARKRRDLLLKSGATMSLDTSLANVEAIDMKPYYLPLRLRQLEWSMKRKDVDSSMGQLAAPSSTPIPGSQRWRSRQKERARATIEAKDPLVKDDLLGPVEPGVDPNILVYSKFTQKNFVAAPKQYGMSALKLRPGTWTITKIPLTYVNGLLAMKSNAMVKPIPLRDIGVFELRFSLARPINDEFKALTKKGKTAVFAYVLPHCDAGPRYMYKVMTTEYPHVKQGDWHAAIFSPGYTGHRDIRVPLTPRTVYNAALAGKKAGDMNVCVMLRATQSIGIVAHVNDLAERPKLKAVVPTLWIGVHRGKDGKPFQNLFTAGKDLEIEDPPCFGEKKENCKCMFFKRCEKKGFHSSKDPKLCSELNGQVCITKKTPKCEAKRGYCTSRESCTRNKVGQGMVDVEIEEGLCPGSKNIVCCKGAPVFDTVNEIDNTVNLRVVQATQVLNNNAKALDPGEYRMCDGDNCIV